MRIIFKEDLLMKKFQNAELVELNIEATAQADPNPTGLDAKWADKDARQIDMDTIVAGVPYASGDKTGIVIDMPA